MKGFLMRKGPGLEYRMETEVGTILIHGEVTNEDAVELRKNVVHWALEHHPKGVTLSFDSSQISSLGIGAVIAIYQDLQDASIKLAICVPEEMMAKMIQAKIDKILDIFTDESETIRHVRGDISR